MAEKDNNYMMVGTVTGKFHSSILITEGWFKGRLTPRRRWASYLRVNENVCKNIINRGTFALHGMDLIIPLKPVITTTKIVVDAIKVHQVQSQFDVSSILHPEGQKTTYARWKLMERTRHVKTRSTPLQHSLYL